MDDYNLFRDLLDTFQSAPDGIKALMLILSVILLLGLVALVLHHLRLAKRIERECRIEIDQHREDMNRWAEALEADLRWRGHTSLAGLPPPPLQSIRHQTGDRLVGPPLPKKDEEEE